MQTVTAHEKLTTRLQSRPSGITTKQAVEIRSTHAVECVFCGSETRILATKDEANTFGSCEHFVRIERSGETIEVLFDERVRTAKAGAVSGPKS